MKVERIDSVLKDFDFALLDDENFREDSVREEIILPILKGLGYSSGKPNQIIRGKRLLHPFVSIGSARKKIHLIPDYLMQVSGQYAWLLDAKAPDQKIILNKHVEQAYSYAMHSEIRVPYFSLCNGREFVLYHISEDAPLLHFDMRLISSYWENLLSLLSPKSVLDYDYGYKKDFGLHLKRLGFTDFQNLVFPDVPIRFIGRIDEDLYSIGSGLNDGSDDYVATFDFNSNTLESLREKIPDEAYGILTSPYRNAIENVSFVDETYRLSIDCKVGDNLVENDKEIFLPFWVNRFL